MQIEIRPDPSQATLAAADHLSRLLTSSETRTLMTAAGNTPLDLYAEIARRGLPLAHLDVFVLDEYVGVPVEHARTCAGILRHAVEEAWRIPERRFHTISSLERDALESILAHEACINTLGGIDVIVLGLGQNGHLGFNEPGSAPDSTARVLHLEPISVEANHKWFGGEHAPRKGATVGLKTIIAAKHVILLAFGEAKRAAVEAMVKGPRSAACPASWLQGHADAVVFLDPAAAASLAGPPSSSGSHLRKSTPGGSTPAGA